MTAPANEPVSTGEIAALLAWARTLSDAGPHADPTQRAAYQAAETALLTRLTPSDTDPAKDTP